MADLSVRPNLPVVGVSSNPQILDKKAADRESVKELSKQFESIFHNMVLKTMRQSVQKSKLIDGGNAESIYQSMLDTEYAKVLSEQGQTGLAEQIERQLLDKMGIKTDPSVNRLKALGKKVYVDGLKNSPLPKG